MKNYRIHIGGTVQGVGFRYHSKKVASALGLKGFVMNKPDETVYIEIEGAEHLLKEFIRWCHSGPDRAVVKKVEIEEGTVQNYTSFETRFLSD